MRWLDNLRTNLARRMAVVDGGNVTDVLAYLDTYYSTGDQADVNKTAAVEFALGMVGRAFMLAEPRPALPGLTPLILSMLGRQTVSLGNAVFRIGMRRETADFQLLPVMEWSVNGAAAPETWRYTIKQNRPNGKDPFGADQIPATNVPAEGMVHIRYSPPSSEPWMGRSPLISAGITAETLAKIERSLKYDSSVPTGGIMPQPDAASKSAINQAHTALTEGKGGITLVETTAGGWGAGTQAAPKADWQQKRFGPMTPESSIALWEAAMRAVIGSLGSPPSLFTSEGGALRESYRHFFTGTIEPLGGLIAQELSEKLEQDIELSFPEVVKSDISARSRAYASFLGSGMEDDEARRIVGLPR